MKAHAKIYIDERGIERIVIHANTIKEAKMVDKALTPLLETYNLPVQAEYPGGLLARFVEWAWRK